MCIVFFEISVGLMLCMLVGMMVGLWLLCGFFVLLLWVFFGVCGVVGVVVLVGVVVGGVCLVLFWLSSLWMNFLIMMFRRD